MNEDNSQPGQQTSQQYDPANGREGILGPAGQQLAALQGAILQMEQGVAVFGPDQRLILYNDRFESLLALSAGGLITGRTTYVAAMGLIAAVARADDSEEIDYSLRKSILGLAATRMVARLEVPIAGGKWVQLNVNPSVQAGTVVTVTDISALKQSEAQLRRETDRARRQLHDAIEAMSEGFVLYDAEDRLVLFNRRYRDEFSFAPEALVPGTTYAEILRRGVADSSVPLGYDIEKWVAERVEAHRNPPPPYLVERSDNRWTLMTEYRTREGGIVGIRADVTDFKVREQNAKANEQLLRELLDAVPALIHTKDCDLRYDLVNRYFLEMWNLRFEDVAGKTQEEVFRDEFASA